MIYAQLQPDPREEQDEYLLAESHMVKMQDFFSESGFVFNPVQAYGVVIMFDDQPYFAKCVSEKYKHVRVDSVVRYVESSIGYHKRYSCHNYYRLRMYVAWELEHLDFTLNHISGFKETLKPVLFFKNSYDGHFKTGFYLTFKSCFTGSILFGFQIPISFEVEGTGDNCNFIINEGQNLTAFVEKYMKSENFINVFRRLTAPKSSMNITEYLDEVKKILPIHYFKERHYNSFYDNYEKLQNNEGLPDSKWLFYLAMNLAFSDCNLLSYETNFTIKLDKQIFSFINNYE